MAEGGLPSEGSSTATGHGTGGYVPNWTSLDGLCEIDNVTFEELPYIERKTLTEYSALKEEKTGKALCVLHRLADGQVFMKNLKGLLNLLSVDNVRRRDLDSKIFIWRNNAPSFLGLCHDSILLDKTHAPIANTGIYTTGSRHTAHVNDFYNPSIQFATLQADVANCRVALRFSKGIPVDFKAIIIAYAIKKFKVFANEYAALFKCHETNPAKFLFKLLYRKDYTPGVSHATQIGSQATDLTAFDNVSDIVVRQIAKIAFEERGGEALYALRAASDNAPLFMAYPSHEGAYTITNATNTETILFTEDHFCDSQKSAIFSWNQKSKYEIGKVSRLSVTCSAADFEVYATNNGAYLAPFQYYFICSKSEKVIAVITAILEAKSILIRVEDNLPNAGKVLIIAFALHRFHEFSSKFSDFNVQNATEFNGDYQVLSKEIFAETNLPLIPPKPIPGQTETAESPDVSSILGTDLLKVEITAIHGFLLSYYLLFNGHSGKVSHIIVNDTYCGRPRMLFRNAANPEEVTFCYETFGLLKRLSVIFDNKTLGEVNFEKNEKITRNNSSNSEYCWVNLENKEATREIFRIVKNRRHMGRLIFDHQQCQVTIEFISRLDIYWRVLFICSAMRKAIAFEYHKKPVQRVSGLDDVIAIVRRINQ